MKNATRLGIQLKVGGILSLLLLLAFLLSGWFSTWHTLKTLSVSNGKAMEALDRTGLDRARNVFASLEIAARDSLERGEMEVFGSMLQDLGRIEGVDEIGLTDAAGKIVYANRQEALDNILPQELLTGAVAAGAEVLESFAEQSVTRL